jgi:hypothetical protein
MKKSLPPHFVERQAKTLQKKQHVNIRISPVSRMKLMQARALK